MPRQRIVSRGKNYLQQEQEPTSCRQAVTQAGLHHFKESFLIQFGLDQLTGPADWVFVTLGPLRCD